MIAHAPVKPSGTVLWIAPWERDALQLLAEGYGTSELSGLLGLGTDEIEWLLARLFAAMDTDTPTQAIRIAQKRGLLTVEQARNCCHDLESSPVVLLPRKGAMTITRNQRSDFYSLLASTTRSPEIPESADVYGWLCGSWDLDVRCYGGVNVGGQGLQGEVHAARVLEGRAVQDVWIMPRTDRRHSDSDRAMNMYGTTLRSWDPTSQSWHIAWTNPARGHREEQGGRGKGRDTL